MANDALGVADEEPYLLSRDKMREEGGGRMGGDGGEGEDDGHDA